MEVEWFTWGSCQTRMELLNPYFTRKEVCSMDFKDKIGKEFEGRCNMLISYAFKGRTKRFKISADRIVEIESECD